MIIDDAWLCKGGLFDGIDDYIELSNFPDLVGSRTISAWIKTLDNSKVGQIIFADDEIDSNGNYAISLGDGGKGRVRFYIRGINPEVLDSSPVIENNKWYFVIATYEANTKIKRLIIYDANGNKLDDKTQLVNGTLSIPNGVASIGGETDNEESNNRFKGYIDEVKVWSRELKEKEIEKIYNNEREKKNWDGTNRFCKECIPIAEYRMDECIWDGIVGEVIDSSLDGIDNSGTINGDVSITEEGKICNSGLFNKGAIDIDNLNVFTTSGDKTTVSFWMYWDGTDNVMPFGWYNYGLWIRKTRFGFTTRNSDLYGITAYGLSNGWHHIVAIFTNGDYTKNKLYIDGVEQTLRRIFGYQYPARAYVSSSARIGGLRGENSRYKFKGKLDEVKIWNRELSREEIEMIYNNEKNFINYDGSNRECVKCNYKFDAWDTNITDKNILTKIVNKEFNLTIAVLDENASNYEEFNGTVCFRIISDNYESNWSKILWSFDEEKNVSFLVKRAIKKAKVNFRWVKNKDKNCSLLGYSELNSTDSFAIRPSRFTVIGYNNKIIAGEEFNLTLIALDIKGENTKNYNESIYVENNKSVRLEYNEIKNGCKTGRLKKLNGGNFSDGKANISLKYSEVGDVNITIKEINGSEFALIDSDDTNDSQRLISPITKTISVGVDHFEIDARYVNHNKKNHFTYLDENLTIASMLDINITAKNKDNETLENYNRKCYAKDISINISHSNVNDDKITKIIYKMGDIKNRKVLKEISKEEIISFLYKESNFTTDRNGSTFVKVYINFDRNISKAVSPFEFNITQIDVNDTDGNGSLIVNKSARYYYGNLLLQDIITTQNSFSKSYDFLVYDEKEDNGLRPSDYEVIFNWYKNSVHESIDGNVTKIVISKDYNASNIVTGGDVSVGSIKDGNIVFNILRNNERINFIVVHLLSENLRWLWYSKFNEAYDISNNSTCLNHFCFTITWENRNKNKRREVGSGKFSGTEINITETNTTKRGVKIFR